MHSCIANNPVEKSTMYYYIANNPGEKSTMHCCIANNPGEKSTMQYYIVDNPIGGMTMQYYFADNPGKKSTKKWCHETFIPIPFFLRALCALCGGKNLLALMLYPQKNFFY
jgi:hypothetical protein